MVPDQPILSADEDRLGFSAYAGVFTAFILDRATQTPITIAISGPWGSGKTSLAHLIENGVKASENWSGVWAAQPLICWFNAWHHADAENIGVALASRIARAIAPKRRIWHRLLEPLPRTMLSPERRRLRTVTQGAAGTFVILTTLALLSWLVPTARPTMGAIGKLAEAGSNPYLLIAAGSAAFTLAARAFKVSTQLGSYLESPQETASHGSFDDIQNHLGKLIRQALSQKEKGGRAVEGDRRLIVIIDDLERCSGEKALRVCEIVNQLVAQPGVICVAIADLESLAAAAADRYTDSADQARLGRLYLDKLVNMRFALPPLSTDVVARIFRHTPQGEGG